MRRNLGVGIAIVIALGLALVASNLTRAAGRTATGDDRSRVQTIRLTATSFAAKDVDLHPRGLSLGDSFVATENLFRAGTKAGTDHAICTLTRLEPRTGTPKRFAAQCQATLVLPEGQVTAQGVRTGALSERQPPRFTLAITGGTGAYTTAHGQVRIVDLNATDSRLTLTLIR